MVYKRFSWMAAEGLTWVCYRVKGSYSLVFPPLVFYYHCTLFFLGLFKKVHQPYLLFHFYSSDIPCWFLSLFFAFPPSFLTG